MITRADIVERANEWGLSEGVVEKDYVIGWLLSRFWAFKGGTCLKKCYFETYRFSEDLELRSEWENMLGHQLPALPPLDVYLDEVADLFLWLRGDLVLEDPPGLPVADSDGVDWRPPPILSTWGNSRMETVRCAAANLLLIRLGYKGGPRIVEPYSLRRSKQGHLLL